MLKYTLLVALSLFLISPTFGQEGESPSLWDDISEDYEKTFINNSEGHFVSGSVIASTFTGGLLLALSTGYGLDAKQNMMENFKKSPSPPVSKAANRVVELEERIRINNSTSFDTDDPQWRSKMGALQADTREAHAQLKEARKELQKRVSRAYPGKCRPQRAFNVKDSIRLKWVTGVGAAFFASDIPIAFVCSLSEELDYPGFAQAHLIGIPLVRTLDHVSGNILETSKGEEIVSSATETPAETSTEMTHEEEG